MIRIPEGWKIEENLRVPARSRQGQTNHRQIWSNRTRKIVITKYWNGTFGIYPVKSDGRWSVLDPLGRIDLSEEEASFLLSSTESIESEFFVE